MDWPISWQKVKDSGAVIFDIADYGLVVDPSRPETMETTNVSILSDIEQALNDGKTVFLKGDATKIGLNGYVVGPIMGYQFDSTHILCGFSAASLVTMGESTIILGFNYSAIRGGGVLTGVKMTMHQFVETPIG